MRLPEQSIWDGDIMTALQKLAPRVGFEQRLALGAAIAVGIVAVIVLVLGTDVGVARLGCRFGSGRSAIYTVSVARLGSVRYG